MRADVAKIEEYEKRSHEIKLTPRVDQSDTSQARRAFQRLDQQITNDARSRSRSGNGSVLGALTGLFRGGGGGAAAGGGGFLSSIGSAAGPGIMGIGARPALIGAAAPVVASVLPSLLGVGGTAIGGGLGLGVAGLLGMQAAKPAAALAAAQTQAQQAMAAAVTPAQRQAAQAQLQSVNQQVAKLSPALHSIFTSITQIQTWWEKFTKSLAPMLAPALRQIVPMLTSLGPAIKTMFAGAMTVVVPFVRALTSGLKEIMPLLGQLFRASAPGFAVLTSGLLILVRNILPGLITLVRATAPVMGMFARTLGTLGTDLGKMFAVMAPAVKPSMIILDALLKAVGALLPVIGVFAAFAARILAPVFVVLGKVVQALLPILGSIVKVFAEFAGAVFTDVVAVLGAIATLLKDLAPSFAILAKVAGQVFRTLENSGVFQVLANALEKLAAPLARMINALVKGLVPVLPPVIKFIESLTVILTKGLVDAVTALLPPLTKLALVVIQALVELLPILLPLFTTFVNLLTPVIVRVVQDLASALTAVISAVPASVLRDIALGFIAIWAAIKIGGLIASVSNPVGLIAISVGLLIVGIVELVRHWHRVWTDIKNWAADAWHFIWDGFGKFLLPLLGPVGLIALGVIEVWKHWKQIWGAIKQVGQDFWQWIWSDFGAKILHFLTSTLPDAFATAVKFIGQHWNDIKGIIQAPVKFVVDDVLDGLIRIFDWITSKVGLGKPIGELHPFGLATGGRIPGYGGGDRHMALLEGGEAVISKETTSANAATLAAWGVPGFQRGGRFGDLRQPTGPTFGPFQGLAHKIGDVGKITAAIFSGNTTALVNAIGDLLGHPGIGGAVGVLGNILTAIPRQLIHEIASHFIGIGGGGVVGWPFPRKSLSQLRRVDEGQDMQYPGTTPVPIRAILPGRVTILGPDPGGFGNAYPGQILDNAIMGFKQIYYGHTYPLAGIGGRHVAAGEVIARTGGRTSGGDAAGLSNWLEMGFWPPSWANGPAMHRLLVSGAGAGRAPNRSGAWTLGGLESLWQSAGGPGGLIGHIAGAIAEAESGGNPRARNPSGASGLWQILGQVFPGNIFDPFINARNAVRKYYQAGGFSPWVTYETGAYRNFMDSGGWLMPGGINGTGRPEAVLNPAQSDAFVQLAAAVHAAGRRGDQGSLERKLDRLIRAVERSATVTGGAVADALNGVTRSAAYASNYSAGG